MSYRNSLGATALDNLYCGNVRTLQENLKKLGLYAGTIDGDPGKGTWDGIVSFANVQGISIPARSTNPATQQPLPDLFCAMLNEVANNPALVPTQPARVATVSQMKLSPAKVALLASLRSGAVQRDAPVTTVPEQGWWASQTKTTQYAIMGGGALVALAAIYYATQE